MRELAPFVLLVCACGAAVREPPPAATPPPTPSTVTPPGPSAAETLAAFDALAARASSVAPGMHEVARKEGGADPVELVKAEGRDTCVRVAFEASAPVAAKLVDHAGNVLAATDAPSADGVLGTRGPVCVRKGDVVRGVSDASGAARIRWIAWEAP